MAQPSNMDGAAPGDATSTSRRSRWTTASNQSWWWIPSVVVTVGSLTIGHTILSILGQAPEFFVAQRMSPAEIVLSAILVVMIPVVLALPILLVRVFSARAAQTLLSLIIGVLVGVFALYTLDRLGQSMIVASLGGALVVVVTGLMYLMSTTARRFVRYLAPAPLVILMMFLLASPASSMIFNEEESGIPISEPSAHIPIVVTIVDEMSLATIMDGSGNLASDAFPGLARLAEDGVWYRNAVTIAQQTKDAVPSIMTGVNPGRDLQPTAADHPDSIFSALTKSHDLHILEPITAVCAQRACLDERRGIDEKLGSLLSDLRLVGWHIVTPEALSGGLPPIDQSWANFSSQSLVDNAPGVGDDFKEQVRNDRRGAVAEFGEMIGESSSKPPLLLSHFLFPHRPWEFLQDGTLIQRKSPRSLVDGVPVDDPWRVQLGMQRYLHAARYVDSALQGIVDDLVTAGIYGDALMVVVADHGISFLSGFHTRRIAPENVAQIAPVPLFVKYPLGYEQAPPPGSIDDLRAETIDVVPTVFDVLGARAPYPVDGVSLLDVDIRSAREHSEVFLPRENINYPIDLGPALEASKWYDAIVLTRDPRDIWPPGADPGLIGTEPEVVDKEDVRIGLADRKRYLDLNLDQEPLPLVAAAAVRGVEEGQLMGIMVDGRIVALTQVHINRAGEPEAMGLIPKEALKAGHNDVRMVAIVEDGSVVE